MAQDNSQTPAYNTYIGARYVPIFDGDWSPAKKYEPLVIVQNQGNTYTSKTYVPAGTPLTNTTYWALTGNFNAQVEEYRQQVVDLGNEVAEISTKVDEYKASAYRNILLMADSYGDYPSGGTTYSWTAGVIANVSGFYPNIQAINQGNRGFIYNPSVGTFLDGIKGFNPPDKTLITDIILCAGTNDVIGITTGGMNISQIAPAIKEFCDYCHENFPNAKVQIGFIGNYYPNEANVKRVITEYQKCKNYGATYINNSEYIVRASRFIDSSAIHPTPAGFTQIINQMTNYVMGESVDVNYGSYNTLYTDVAGATMNIPPVQYSQTNGAFYVGIMNNGTSITFTKEIQLAQNFTITCCTFQDRTLPYYNANINIGNTICKITYDDNTSDIINMLADISNNAFHITYDQNIAAIPSANLSKNIKTIVMSKIMIEFKI